jgi:hypothetical protein
MDKRQVAFTLLKGVAGLALIVVAVIYADDHALLGTAKGDRFELTAGELRDLNQPGVSLNAGEYLSPAAEASELSAAERGMLEGLRGSPVKGDQTLLGPKVFPVNRTALTARVVTFTFADGRSIRFVGAPVANFPNMAWTGRSRDRAGMVLDETSQGLIGEIRQGMSYTMATLAPGGRYMFVAPIPLGAFYEPPEMSGHPPFPHGVQ